MEASISSSVRASSAAQSVLPRLGAYLETTIIFSSFVPACSPCRDEPAERAAERARDRDFAAFEISEDLVPDFAMSIRSTDVGIAVEHSFRVIKVDLVIA